MALVTLNLRDLQSGQRMLAEFETLDSCLDWLKARPQFVDVLGTADDSLSSEGEQLLKAALRPYDEEERALMEEYARKRQAELKSAAEQQEMQRASDRAAYESALQKRGPNDPMQLRWARGGQLTKAEPLDPRPIPQTVQEAVDEWVRERDSWVHRRGQRVAEAVVSVWPGEVPQGQERIQQGGQFEVEPLDE